MELTCGEPPFDPSTLQPYDGSPSVWASEKHEIAAVVRYWYRKFYEETRPGQLMVLRPDEPALFHYHEGRRSTDTPGRQDVTSAEERQALVAQGKPDAAAEPKLNSLERGEGRLMRRTTERVLQSNVTREGAEGSRASAAAVASVAALLTRIQYLLIAVVVLLLAMLSRR